MIFAELMENRDIIEIQKYHTTEDSEIFNGPGSLRFKKMSRLNFQTKHNSLQYREIALMWDTLLTEAEETKMS